MDPRPTLLIVDDERGPAESLRMIFKPSFDVFVASHVIEHTTDLVAFLRSLTDPSATRWRPPPTPRCR